MSKEARRIACIILGLGDRKLDRGLTEAEGCRLEEAVGLIDPALDKAFQQGGTDYGDELRKAKDKIAKLETDLDWVTNGGFGF